MPRKRPMTRYVAFLRGINVGGHRVAMERLRGLFDELKLANVATFIASGNVIFDTADADCAAVERRIEAHLHQALGYEVATLLRTPAELAEIIAFRPFAAADLDAPGYTVLVNFLREPLRDADARKLLTMRTAHDDFCTHGREWYWLCRGRMTDSPVGWQQLVKAVPAPTTARNLKTVRQLAAKFPPA